jgi:hypothetical protein
MPIAPSLASAHVAIASPPTSASAPAPTPSASASAPRRLHVGPKPGEPAIACGDETCRAEDEVCCPSSTCEKRVVSKNAGGFEELGPQLRICGGPPKFCGDSSQCETDDLCCLSYFASDADIVRCNPGSCDYAEVCSEGHACKTPRTSCIGGTCRRNDVLCGNTKCDGATPNCCFDEGKLVCAADCKGRSIACTKTADCPGTTKCQASGGRTYCSGVVDIANAQQVCTSDAECKALDICGFSRPSKPFCDKGRPYRVCGCR